jgi:hypothetical protein
MKTRIALGAGLLLTLGTAVAGSLIYSKGQSAPAVDSYQEASTTARSEVTPEMIAMWKASAGSTEYMAPKLPI